VVKEIEKKIKEKEDWLVGLRFYYVDVAPNPLKNNDDAVNLGYFKNEYIYICKRK